MTITLRKANTLQLSIKEAIAGFKINTKASLNEHEPWLEVLANKRKEVQVAVTAKSDLNVALYEIRKAVANANSISGINDFLAGLALVETEISATNILLAAGVQDSVAAIKGSLRDLVAEKASANMYGSPSPVTVSIFDKAANDSFAAKLKKLKRQKVAFKDELLGLNITTTIVLDDVTVATLSKHGII
tara:strand:- start:901 stop:1467 length:567 start_codon:yes stop_codon:yes gene_type:complete